MPAKKSTRKAPLARSKKQFIEPSFLIMIVLVAMAGIAFILYASAATYTSSIR
ncbi:hypothetical protein HYX70_04405 [Candidatus Saccharibacteria bacterium]|nr:hypothetical protein [Candidatus Saccharibacteria bacterium]